MGSDRRGLARPVGPLAHPRTRERFLALYRVASGTHNAASWAAAAGRSDETVLGWLHRSNGGGPDALEYRRTGGARPFSAEQARRVADTAERTAPREHGLPGHLWTLKKLRAWAGRALGLAPCRNVIRRALRAAGLTYRRVKKLLGRVDPAGRAAHVARLEALYNRVCDPDEPICLVSIDEAHFHREMDHGYGWGTGRLCRVSDCPSLSQRLNGYGAYDFSGGQCLLWEDGWCNGANTAAFLRRVAAWREGEGKVVVVWDNAPCHTAGAARRAAAAEEIERVFLPAYSPDLNPIERLWDWLRDDVTRGHCHASLGELRDARQEALAAINADPVAVVDRLWPKFDLDEEVEEKLRVSP